MVIQSVVPMTPLRLNTQFNIERAELKAAIIGSCLRFGDFKLSSGGDSQYYFDLRQLVTQTHYRNMVAKLWLNMIAGQQIDLVAGPAVSGLLPMTSLVDEIYRYQSKWPDLIYLDRKAYGDVGRELHGKLVIGDQVLIVDDVATSGGSIYNIIDKLREYHAHPVGVCVILDRCMGAGQRLVSDDIKFMPLFTRADFDPEIIAGCRALQPSAISA